MANAESLFGLLALSLGNAALVGLGIVPEPGNHKSTVNLEHVSYNIEMLSMLEEKTKGNLTIEEVHLLEGLLYDLRMKFVEARRGAC